MLCQKVHKVKWTSGCFGSPMRMNFQASHYCTGTLGSYDVERSFSTYNSILDPKRRNLNEETLKALHFLNWNLKVKNSIKEENSSPQQKQMQKVSRHPSTKLTAFNCQEKDTTQHTVSSSEQPSVSFQEKSTAHYIASSFSSATSQQRSDSSEDKSSTHHIGSSSSIATLEQTSASSQNKSTTHHIASSYSGATQRMSLKDALKRKKVYELKCCYLCQREVSYGHQCSKCRRVLCTFPSCCSIDETSSSVLHKCKVCSASSGDQDKSKASSINKRKLENLNESGKKKKNSKQKSTDSDNRKEIGASSGKLGMEPIKLSNLTSGMYVCVRFTASKANVSKMFCGIILNVDHELQDLEVRFMKEVKTSGNAIHFVWPKIDDESWININDVVEILKCPVTNNRGHYHF